jgi:hypothetical protein
VPIRDLLANEATGVLGRQSLPHLLDHEEATAVLDALGTVPGRPSRTDVVVDIQTGPDDG